MAPQTLSIQNRAVLKALGKAGDILARAATAAIANDTFAGRAALVAGGTPAAASTTSVHAAVFGDAVGPVTVAAGLTNPDVPRNVEMAFGATWDGGNVTITGTNQFNLAVTETLVANPGNTVVGAKIFKTVTNFSYAGGGVGVHATNTVSVGVGNKIGMTAVPTLASPVLLAVDGVGEAVTFDATNNAFTPTTLPNAAHVYVLTINQ